MHRRLVSPVPNSPGFVFCSFPWVKNWPLSDQDDGGVRFYLFGGSFDQRVPSDGLQYVVRVWSSYTIILTIIINDQIYIELGPRIEPPFLIRAHGRILIPTFSLIILHVLHAWLVHVSLFAWLCYASPVEHATIWFSRLILRVQKVCIKELASMFY